MSNELEQIVRPSESVGYAPAQVYYKPGQAGTPNTVLQLGRSGKGKMFSGSGSASATHYMTQYVNEKRQDF